MICKQYRSRGRRIQSEYPCSNHHTDNHGNITGNYTVMRDLGSDAFRERNKASDLADTFAELRRQRFDLSPTLVTHPQLAQDAAVDQFGRLHLVGFFGTRPQAVRFSIFFQPVNGGWMIDEVAVAIVPTETVSIQ